jgi:hypothetical protein
MDILVDGTKAKDYTHLLYESQQLVEAMSYDGTALIR